MILYYSLLHYIVILFFVDENLKEISPIDNETVVNKDHEVNVDLNVTNQKLKINEKIGKY